MKKIEIDKDGRVRIDVGIMSLLKPIPKGNYYKARTIKDKNLMGFRARVAPGGQRAFVYRYRPKGKDEKGNYFEKVNKTLGPWYDKNDPKEKDLIGITPAVARKMAEEMRGKILRGEDPNTVVVRRSKGKTLCDVSKLWIDNRSKSFKSHENYLSLFNVYIKQNSKQSGHRSLYKMPFMDIVNRAMVDLTKDDYLQFHRAVMKGSKYQANRVIEVIQSVEEYAEETGIIKKRIAYFKKKELFKEKGRLDREDPYTRSELGRYRKAMLKKIKQDRDRFLVPCFALRGARLIGARSKNQVFSLEWDQINIDNNKIKYIDTKNDEPMTLYFDYRFKAVLRIMAKHRRTINHRDKRFKYVFPTRFKVRKNLTKNKLVKVKTHHIKDPRKTHASIIKLAKLPYKCIHFLRHSWATIGYGITGDSKAIQELGGWLDHKSVEKYIKVSEEVKRRRINQMAKARSHVA
jgi:site-specific recombinase XerD